MSSSAPRHSPVTSPLPHPPPQAAPQMSRLARGCALHSHERETPEELGQKQARTREEEVRWDVMWFKKNKINKAHLRKYKNNMNWEERPKRTRKTQGSDPDLQPSHSDHFISFIYSNCLCHALLGSNIHFIRSKQSSITVQEHLHVLSQLSCRQFCQMQSTLRIHLISSLHNYSWN